MTPSGTRAIRHPPGRAGRIWLERRLAAATRGAELLERKLGVLRREERRLTILADGTRGAWESACADAEQRGLIAAVLGGEDPVPAPSPAADVEVSWTAFMGVRYPARATCRIAHGPPLLLDPSAAVPPARDSYRKALEAGTAHAAAVAARDLVAAEVLATRTRLRAIEDHWRPGLERALAGLRAKLAEEEAADGARLRLWSRAAGGPAEP
jgi:V/A-type H+-transporting ATPase subunit D